MKKVLPKIVILCGIFIAISLSAVAQGRDVTIFLKNGTQKSGELLSVRDSLISFLKERVEDEEDIIDRPALVDIALIKDIEKVRIEENDVSGAGTGALIGGALYTGIGVAVFGGDEIGNVLLSAAGGAIVGAGIGWVFGLLASEEEEIVRPSSKSDLLYLEGFALMDEGEPRYIRDIINNLLKETK